MNKYTCLYCEKKYDSQYKEREKKRFCSLLCKDMQAGKDMGKKWIESEKKDTDESQIKMQKHRREISHYWATRSMAMNRMKKYKEGE